MVENSPAVPLTKNPHGYEKAIRELIKGGATEEEARNEVASGLKKMRENPDSKLILRALRQARKEAEERSLVDALTGLPNRRALLGDDNVSPPIVGELVKMFAHAQRSNEPLALLMIDLDFFKKYNDTYGHPAGDEALRELAKIIRKIIRKGDFAARYGGEEFTVVLPQTDYKEALNLAQRLRTAVGESTAFRKTVTLSIGLADYPNPSYRIEGPPDLIKLADSALYKAKDGGRNRVVVITTEKPVT